MILPIIKKSKFSQLCKAKISKLILKTFKISDFKNSCFWIFFKILYHFILIFMFSPIDPDDIEFVTLRNNLKGSSVKYDGTHKRNFPALFNNLLLYLRSNPRLSFHCGMLIIGDHIMLKSHQLHLVLCISKSTITAHIQKHMAKSYDTEYSNALILHFFPDFPKEEYRKWTIRPFYTQYTKYFSPNQSLQMLPTSQFAPLPIDTFLTNYQNLRDLDHFNLTDYDMVLFLEKYKLIRIPQVCDKCAKEMSIKEQESSVLGRTYLCTKCGTTKSLFKDSFFAGFRHPIKDILSVAYCFAQDFTFRQIEQECRVLVDTIIEIVKRFRKCILNKRSKQPHKIGGELHTVKMDETFITRRKDNRDCEYWFIGAIDTTTDEIFLDWNSFRDTDIIRELIYNNIEFQTEIITDGWAAYRFLERDLNYSHQAVVHDDNFVDAITKIHTQEIERLWVEVKEMKHRRRGFFTNKYEEVTAEFVWRKNELSKRTNKVEAVVELMAFYNDLD